MKRSHNLKFIKLFYKGFVDNIIGYGPYKELSDISIDRYGDTVLAIPRFGKKKVVHVYVNVEENRFVNLRYPIKISHTDVQSMYPKCLIKPNNEIIERIMKSKAGENIEYKSSQVRTIDLKGENGYDK
jgi:hypothetical protein